MRRIIYTTTLALSLSPTMMFAQQEVTREPVVLSLEDAMKYAVKNNANAKNARLDVKMQRAKNNEVTGIAYPQLKAEGQFSQYPNPVKSFLPGQFSNPPVAGFVPVQFTPTYASSATASGSQIIFDGSVMVALQARNALIKLYEQKAQMSEEELRYSVQKAYYAFVIAQRQYSILKSSLAYARNMANDIVITYQNGFAEKIDVDRTNVQVNNLATDSIKTSSMIAISEQLLKYTIGMDIGQPIILTDTSVEAKVSEASAMLLNTDADYNDRTEFGILQTTLKLHQYDLKRHRLSALPSLAAFASAGYNYSTNSFADIFDKRYVFYSMYGLKMSVPIFDGFQRHNRAKQAKINIEKTKNDIDNLKLGIDFQTEQSKTTLKNALLMLASQERNLQLANSVLDLSRNKYKAGVGSNTEVSQAQTEMLKAQNNYFSSMLEVVNAKSDLQKATGQFK